MRLPESLAERLENALAENDPATAATLLETAGYARDPFESLSAHRGLVHVQCRQDQKALAAIWRATVFYPLRAEPWSALGSLLEKAGEPGLALWALETSARLDPENAIVQDAYIRLLARKRPQAGRRYFLNTLPELAGLPGPRRKALASLLELTRFGLARSDAETLCIEGYSTEATRIVVHITDGTTLRAKSFDVAPDEGGAWRIDIAWPPGAVAAQALWEDTQAPLAPGTVIRTFAPSHEDQDEDTAPSADVDIIIPVYLGLAETRACLASVLQARCETRYRLILVEDASPEPALRKWVRDLADRGDAVLISNPLNLGFTGSVNRALARTRDRDVVLLNADTVVCDGWLDRLRKAALSADDIGTAVPLSNNAQLTSYPEMSLAAPLPDAKSLQQLDAAAARVNAGKTVDIPTGTGFCLYIRRACLDRIGPPDQVGFGRGYGEDVDFCMRALAAGWRNVCATDVFVGHHGTVSFGDEKSALVGRNMTRVAERHPTYRQRMHQFMSTDPLEDARQALARATWPDLARGRVLVFGPPSWAQFGTLRHYAFERAARGEKLLWLSVDPRQSDGRIVLEDDQPGQSVQMLYCNRSEREDLLRDLAKVGIIRIDVLTRVPTRLRWLLDALDAPRHLHATNRALLIDMVRVRADRIPCYSTAAAEAVPANARERVVRVPQAELEILEDRSGRAAPNIAVLAGPEDPAGMARFEALLRHVRDADPDLNFYTFQPTLDDLALARTGLVHPLGAVASDTRRELARALRCAVALVIGHGDDLQGWAFDLACQTCPRIVATGDVVFGERAAAHPRATVLPSTVDAQTLHAALRKSLR